MEPEPGIAFGNSPSMPEPVPTRGADSLPTARADAPSARAARTLPMAVFLAVLGLLLAIAGVSLFMPGTVVEGLPRDPSARAARDLLFGRVMPPCDGLRFRSAFLGEYAPPIPPRPLDPALLARAEMLLLRAHQAHPLEPRGVAALGHLELARRQLERAAARYRRAIELRAHCSEARLGLGVALALESDRDNDAFRRRILALEALAQFTAVRPESELALDALYDRALMLERVGRHDAARELAQRYFARDPTGFWAERLRSELGITH